MEPIENVQDMECVGEDFGENSLPPRGLTIVELVNENPAKTLPLKRPGQQSCARCRRQKLRVSATKEVAASASNNCSAMNIGPVACASAQALNAENRMNVKSQ
jgi:hypothetical protein